MFTGSVYFKFTPNGYVVDDFMDNPWLHGKVLVNTDWWPGSKLIRVEGTFNFKPVKGQFCKKPHKLIVWSK